jgi:hypothetical protein
MVTILALDFIFTGIIKNLKVDNYEIYQFKKLR